MPEKRFDIQWPNGHEESCYSPSSIISEYLTEGESYALNDFVDLAERGLTQASERVRTKYGFTCSSAMDQLTKIKHVAAQFERLSKAQVVVKRIY